MLPHVLYGNWTATYTTGHESLICEVKTLFEQSKSERTIETRARFVGAIKMLVIIV